MKSFLWVQPFLVLYGLGKSQIRTLSCLVGHMLCCLNVRVNDEAGKGGGTKIGTTFNESTYLDLIDKLLC